MAEVEITEKSKDSASALTKATVEVAQRLGMTSVELGSILGTGHSSASRLMTSANLLRGKHPEWELAVLLVRIYRGLYTILGGNAALLMDWLQSRNQAFDDQIPFDVIQQPGGLAKVCDYIEANLTRP